MSLFPAMIQAQSHSKAEPLTKERKKKRPLESKGNRCRDVLLTSQQRNSVTHLVADLHCC